MIRDSARASLAALLALLAFFPFAAVAQEPAADESVDESSGEDTMDVEAIHDALRSVRDRAVAALNGSDVDALLALAHDEVVFTAMNAEVARGKDAIRAYFDKMMVGPDRIVESMTTEIKVDTLSILHGDDTAIAYGSSHDRYRLTDGLELEVDARWTSTLVRVGDDWLIASFHSSVNVFDNPLLAASRRLLYWVGGAALALGLVAGWLIGRRAG